MIWIRVRKCAGTWPPFCVTCGSRVGDPVGASIAPMSCLPRGGQAVGRLPDSLRSAPDRSHRLRSFGWNSPESCHHVTLGHSVGDRGRAGRGGDPRRPVPERGQLLLGPSGRQPRENRGTSAAGRGGGLAHPRVRADVHPEDRHAHVDCSRTRERGTSRSGWPGPPACARSPS